MKFKIDTSQYQWIKAICMNLKECNKCSIDEYIGLLF